VEHQFGKGRTLLIGTFAGGGYYLHHSATEKAFFNGLLQWANAQPALRSDTPGTQARLHTGVGGTYLYLVNW
jgi:beta-galactosidase